MEHWRRTTLGRTGCPVGRLGLSASYGADARCVALGFERGVNYFYWGSIRESGFGEGLRQLRSRRDEIVLVIQSYSRVASLLGWSVERALRSLHMDYADVLLLGYWNSGMSGRIVDAAVELRRRGLVRHLAISTHNRQFAVEYARNPAVGALHVRYNAVHPGAERDIFPHLATLPLERPGIVAFTATSWGGLMTPDKVPAGDPVPTAGDAYRFVLTNPAVDVCMTGPAHLKQFTAALDAWDKGPLTSDQLAWMRRVGQAKYERPGRFSMRG